MKMSINNLQSIVLGREKDGGVKTIEIDCSEWKEKFPQLTKYRIEVTSPNGIIYCPEVTMNEHILTWPITKSDTALTGKGAYQIVATGENGERLTSAHLSLNIYSIMPGTAQETPPEYIESWVQNIVDTAERAELAAKKAEDAAAGIVITPEEIQSAVDNYLIKNPIKVKETDPTVPDWAKEKKKPTYTAEEVGAQPKGDYALKSDIPAVPVKSVNGKTGTVVLNASDVGAQPKGDYALKSDIPEILVKSVNGKTGDVVLTAQNVGALPADAEIVDQTARDGVATLSKENAAQNTSLKQLSDEVRGINGVTETVIVPIDDSDIIDGYLIMEGTGSQVKSTNWTCTDWIPVSFDGGSNITAKCVLFGSGAFVFYNSLKNPILSISGNNCSDYGITASAEPQTVALPCPEHTAYIRMSMLKSAYNTDGKGYELSGYVTESLSNMIAAANRNISDVERRLNLNVTNFHDKKVLVFGDSISADYYGNYPKWVTHLTEERFFDAEKTTNDSTHATGFVARYSEQPNDFITRMEAISAADTYDIVIVFGGINDYIQSIPMGESGGDKLTHFKPAVDYFFATLAERFVNARLLVLLPMRTDGYGNKNGAGCTQADYAEYIRTVAMQYAMPVLNLMDDSGFNPKLPVFKNRWTLTEYSGGDGVTGDGVHPNEEYERRFLAPMIRAFLQSVM